MNPHTDGSKNGTHKLHLAALLLILMLFMLACEAPFFPLELPEISLSVSPEEFIDMLFPDEEQAADEATQPSDSASPELPQTPADASDAATPPKEEETGSVEVIGGWYGAFCDEAEGTFLYRWSVDLMQNPKTREIVGTVKFHDCPGGGRVRYYVIGEPQKGPVYILLGEKKSDGGGALLESAPASIDFTFDSDTGQITPNLAP
jgi:hypothetical protein